MQPLACPHCTEPIAEDGRCAECGLDASLLVQIRRAAEALAHQAAQQAAQGEWQAAYDTATESLRLARQDNDLAAFVVIVTSLAGARGPVSSLPRPRAEALPPSLAPLVDEMLTVAQRLRSMGEESVSTAEIEAVLRQLDRQHPLLPLLPPPAAEPTRPRLQWPLVTTAAGVALLIGALTGGWTGQETTRRELRPRIAELEKQLRKPQPPATPTVTSAQARNPEPLLQQVQAGLSEEAWRRGRDASRRKHYREARQFLEVAAQAPRGSWYWDDSVYYLAKTYHRLRERDKAAATYLRLEREAPGSGYVPEARRLLARLEKGQEVDQ